MKQKILFIINPGSGSHQTDFSNIIKEFFSGRSEVAERYELPKKCDTEKLKGIIHAHQPNRVIAVGGDGTLKLVAECLLNTRIPIGLIPTGSANGMAKELGIPSDLQQALELCVTGRPRKIHAVKVNGQLCIHLADIGFNAYVVKEFDKLPQRGMLAYARAAWQALWRHHKMEVEFKIGGQEVKSEAAMVVIANATMYGTGVKINPEGRLDDEHFEIILVKKYSFLEILKIRFTNLPFNPEKIETFQTGMLTIRTKHRAHFQVDGEYQGKVVQIQARILPEAICIIAPPEMSAGSAE